MLFSSRRKLDGVQNLDKKTFDIFVLFVWSVVFLEGILTNYNLFLTIIGPRVIVP